MIIFPSCRAARRRELVANIAGTGANGTLAAGRGQRRQLRRAPHFGL